MAPPSRKASFTSRRSRARAALTRRAPCRRARACARISLLSGVWLATIAMPPAVEMILDGGVEQPDRGGVERDLRLVEQPDRARRGEQAGQRELPLLSGREQSGGKLRQRGEPEGGERAVEARAVLAEEAGPEGEVLAHAEARLHRVQMADIVAKLGELGVGGRAVEVEPPCGKRQQPGDLPQQAGLAGAVRARSRSSASPGASSKLRPSNTVRPPRWQAMS